MDLPVDRQCERKDNELKIISIESSQTKAKRVKSLQKRISEWDNVGLSNIHIIGVPEGKKKIKQKSIKRNNG